MKFNIAYPVTGKVKVVTIEEDRKILPFLDRRMGHEIEGEVLGDEYKKEIFEKKYKGYLFRIAGGNDKQGFPMMQGVMSNQRVRLLFSKGMKTFRERRKGSRKRKSVRGCIVGSDLAVLCLTVIKKGDAEVAGLTDETLPRRLGPKRANKIRSLFNLSKTDDVRKYVVRRKIEKNGKTYEKAPKIQRLITPNRLQRKRRYMKLKRVTRGEKAKEELSAHRTRKAQWLVEQKQLRADDAAKKKKAEAAKKQKA